jgi:hypothetical protein
VKKLSPIQKTLGGLTKVFRGTIFEDALSYKLVGGAYKAIPPEQNSNFWISSARHLTGALLALNDPDVRVIFIIGSTQGLKTLAGDLWTVFVMVHAPRDMLVLFESDKKAKEFCEIRLMEVLENHPIIKKQIAEVDRHDVTKTYVKLAGMDLLAAGMNDSNLSTFSWPYIRISECWQMGKNGLLKKAFKRADRYPHDSKILVDSQAGRAGEDLHIESSLGHQVHCSWACPYCGGRQTWECSAEYGNLRGADFVALPANPPVAEPPTPGSYSGMKFPKEGTIQERAAAAYWECHWCGTGIEDTEKIRRAIMDTYETDYRVKKEDGTFTPKIVTFVLPRECMYNNSFASGVESYLMAKEAEQSGNMTLLENWYMSERAIFYAPRMSQTRMPVVTASVIDPAIAIPNESFRSLQVDCQKAIAESEKLGKDVTGHFWWTADAVDKSGNTVQLERGYAVSWEELFGKEGVKNRLKIPTRNVAIDGGYQFDEVKEKAAQYRTIEKAMDGSGKSVFATWKIFLGDDYRSYKWDDGGFRIYKMPQTYYVDIMEKGKWLKVAVQVTRWSSFSVKNQLALLLQGLPGKPKITAVETSRCNAKTQAMEQANCTYENQMNSEMLGMFRGKMKWLPIHPENHYRDDACMGIVLKAMMGLIGHVAPADEAAQESQ